MNGHILVSAKCKTKLITLCIKSMCPSKILFRVFESLKKNANNKLYEQNSHIFQLFLSSLRGSNLLSTGGRTNYETRQENLDNSILQELWRV